MTDSLLAAALKDVYKRQTMLWSWIFGNEWAVTQEGEMIYGTEAERYNTCLLYTSTIVSGTLRL